MKQMSIEVPDVYRTEEVDIGRIIVDEKDEASYRDIFKSVSAIKSVLQHPRLIEDGGNYRVIYGSRRILAAKKAVMKKNKGGYLLGRHASRRNSSIYSNRKSGT